MKVLRNCRRSEPVLLKVLTRVTSQRGLTERSLVQEVELGVEALQLRVSVLDGAHDEVQQRLPAVRGLGVQQLGDGSEQEELIDPNINNG